MHEAIQGVGQTNDVCRLMGDSSSELPKMAASACAMIAGGNASVPVTSPSDFEVISEEKWADALYGRAWKFLQ